MTSSPTVRDERGQGAIVLLLVLPVLVAAVGLLARTNNLATNIDTKSKSIAEAGAGINSSTAAIIKLDKTNEFGRGILESAKPLEKKLDEVVRIANSIDATAGSINATAGAINGSANGINRTATGILDVAQSIKRGVAQINRNVDVTAALIKQIQADTTNIVTQARTAMKEGACIDRGLALGGVNSNAPDDGHCR